MNFNSEIRLTVESTQDLLVANSLYKFKNIVRFPNLVMDFKCDVEGHC